MATALGIFFIIVCVLLVLLVLLQKGRGGGLGAALGGFGSSAFGTKTGDMATVVTIVLASIYLLIGVVATYAFRPDVEQLPPPILSVAGSSVEQSMEVAPDTSVYGSSQYKGVVLRFTWGDEEVGEFSPQMPPLGLQVKFGQDQRRRVLNVRAYREGFPPSQTKTVTFVKKLPPAPAPEILPASKPISEPLEITIVANDEDATTRFTLDGTTPTGESTLYEGPLTVQPGTIVKAINFLEQRKPSVVVTETYPPAPAPGPGGDAPDDDPGSGDEGGDTGLNGSTQVPGDGDNNGAGE
jgi:protein translocase SecG subunit